MARYKHFGYVRDGHGHVISNATVSVYEGGSTTAATVWDAYSSGNNSTSVSSGNNGYYEFYVDSGNYSAGQTFKLVVSKSGFNSTTIDYIRIIGL